MVAPARSKVLRRKSAAIRWCASGSDGGEQRRYGGVTIPLMFPVNCAWALEGQCRILGSVGVLSPNASCPPCIWAPLSNASPSHLYPRSHAGLRLPQELYVPRALSFLPATTPARVQTSSISNWPSLWNLLE
jgi:hypothetical protein